MNVRNLFTDDDAVSPVIGVILMVAITVILAAVIGAFVLNIGGSQEAAPQATLQWETASDHVEASHQGGDAIPSNEVDIKVDSVSNTYSIGSEVSAGDTIWVDTGGAQVNGAPNGTASGVPSGEVSIVWNSPSSDKSSIISSYTPS